MKTPRADDFYVDSKAAHRLKSPLDGLPRIVPPSQRSPELPTPMRQDPQVPSPPRPGPRTGIPQTRTPELVNARRPEDAHAGANARPPVRRHVKRYSYELYEDQIERVKRLALEDQLRGGSLNQSEIIRTALDRYLAEL